MAKSGLGLSPGSRPKPCAAARRRYWERTESTIMALRKRVREGANFSSRGSGSMMLSLVEPDLNLSWGCDLIVKKLSYLWTRRFMQIFQEPQIKKKLQLRPARASDVDRLWEIHEQAMRSHVEA